MHLRRLVSAGDFEGAGRLAAGLGVFVVLAGLALPARGAAGAEPAEGLVEIGRFGSSMTPATRFLEADAAARRLFEIGQPRAGRGMRIDAYDLDRLTRLGSITVPDAHSGFGGKLAATDQLRHRMFVVYPLRQADDSALRNLLGSNETTVDSTTRTYFAIAVVDTLSLRLLGARALPELGALPLDITVSNGVGLKAVSYFAPEDKLYLVAQATVGASELAPSNHVVRVYELDASRLLGGAPTAVNWAYPLTQCAMTMAKERPGVIFRSARRAALYLPCREGNIVGPQQPLETPGIVRINITPGSSAADVSRFGVEFFPFSGSMQSGFVVVDPVSERLLLRVDASATESGVWVFDTAAGSWLGNIVSPGGGAWGVAVDPAIGRLYALSPPRHEPFLHVLAVISSTRGAEADQGRVFQARLRGVPVPVPPLVDPVRRRLYWSSAEQYIVLEDQVPVPAGLAPGDPDAGTIDLPEGAGTAVNFLGGAQAFGSRVRWVGGTRGVERNVNTLLENFQPPPLPLQQFFPPSPGPGTRDVHLARVARATISNGEATASAAGADRDRENTDGDLVNYTVYMRDRGGPNLVNQRWPYRAVSCTDFGGPADRREDSAVGAAVSCRRNDGQVTTSAETQLPLGVPDVTIAYSRAATTQRRDAKLGIVSVAEAEARGIEITGRAGIGRVASRAESRAAGRPGTAGSTYTRSIEDVWVQTDAGRRQVCSSPCSPEAVRDALNQALGTRIRVDLPSPDAERAKGTPGGYEALVVRDAFDRANDAALNDEAGIRLEVPAMVVTVFADGRNRSRVVTSLAATSAESHYGIYLLARALPPETARAVSVLGSGVAADPGGPLGPAVEASGVGVSLPESPVPALFGEGVATVVRKTFAGVRFFFASPGQAVRAFGLWLFLAAPLLLWIRRRPA